MTEKKAEEKKISRRTYLKYAGAGAVVIAAGAAGAYYMNQPSPTPTQTGTTAGTTAAGTTGPVAASTPNDTLVIGTNETPLFLEPATVSYYIDYMVTHTMFQGLLEFKRDTSQIVFEPRLAADFPEIGGTPHGTEYTFKIRQDQKILFHDGSQLDAHSVEYSFKRISRLLTGSAYFYADDIAAGKIEATDDWTIKFTLPKPVAPTVMYAKFASDCGYIVSQKAVEQYGDEGFNDHPVGTGPWKLDHWTKGTEIQLVRNDDYWEPDGPAKLKSLLWKQYGDPTTIGLALKNGEIDVAGRYIPIPDIPPLQTDPNLQDLSSTFPWVRYLVLNPGTSAALQNQYNRKAIAYAIDWDNVIKVAMKGQAKRLYSHLNPSFPDYIPAQQQVGYKYDPDMAKQMLQKAGNPDGFSTMLWYTPDYGPEEGLVATMIQQYLNAVGISTAVSFAAKAQFISMVRGGEMMGGGGQKGLSPMPIFQYGWVPDYWSPDNYYAPFIYPGTYIAGYSGFNTVNNPAHPEAKTMLDNYRQAFDAQQATKISQDVQTFIADQCDVIDYFYPIDAWYGWKNVQGWAWPGVYNNIDFRKVYKQ